MSCFLSLLQCLVVYITTSSCSTIISESITAEFFGEYAGGNHRYLQQVSDFTRYAYNLQLDSAERPWCNANDLRNETWVTFNKYINTCPSPLFAPRWLTVQQISWKSVRKDAMNRGGSSKYNQTANTNITTPPIGPEPEKNKTKDIIHKYLAFAILLPKHPFSADLFKALLAVGPMFPSVSFVSGTGYDFTDMCAQYNVRSFPQILFFKDGLLKGRFDGEHTPERLAFKLAEWTNLFPRSYPSTHNEYEAISVNARKNLPTSWWSFTPRSVLFNLPVFGYNVTARVPYSTEPIMGTFEFLVPYDSFVFIAAGLYVIARSIYFLWPRKDGNVAEIR